MSSATQALTAFVFDSGGDDVLRAPPGLPATGTVTVTNGTIVDLQNSPINLGSGTIIVTGGSIVDGSLTGGSFELDNATIDADITVITDGQRFRVAGRDG